MATEPPARGPAERRGLFPWSEAVLEVRAAAPGVDYRGAFVLPVYARA